ncbi:MAG: hypothetical protein JNJ61_10765 [Anaerolineae bacterium]|nr:hypothetical protein [Anaerolineae bacterium]
MPPLRETIRTTLAGDATLTALLPGGIFDADTLPQDGGGAASAPRTADGVRINPFGIVRWRGANRAQVEVLGRSDYTETVEVYLYQDIGQDVLEQATTRIQTLLHNQYLPSVTDRGLAHFIQTFVSGELPAEEFGNAACRFIRFQVVSIR